jgi:hypothetical protein
MRPPIEQSGVENEVGILPESGSVSDPGSLPERSVGSLPERSAGGLPERSEGSLTETSEVDTSLLPLIVWLRGDESWCEQFSLDAEAVMARLGIRRSRLTQISGKELRVGRIRRGRHVVPVYRPQDVESYLGWARAPATHMKSATALQEATTALERRGEALAAVAAEAPAKVAEAVDERVRGALRGTTRVLVEAVAALSDDIAALSATMSASNQDARRLGASVEERLTRLEAAAEKLATAALSQAQDLTELTALARLQGESVRESLVYRGERDVVEASRWDDALARLAALEAHAEAQRLMAPKANARRNVADSLRLRRRGALSHPSERAAPSPAAGRLRRRRPFPAGSRSTRRPSDRG